MTAFPVTLTPGPTPPPAEPRSTNRGFLEHLPAVHTHAHIQFRHLNQIDREEAVAEAVAGAFCNYASTRRRRKAHAIAPTMLAQFGVLHVKTGRHIGGAQDSKRDVLSWRAQRAGGFKVRLLGWNDEEIYDCLTAPDQPVWRWVLLEDHRTPVPDQVAFRLDWSTFLAQQTDRTRQAIGMLAAGHRRCEVADRLGVTRPALTQRMNRVRRDWGKFRADGERSATESPAHAPRTGPSNAPPRAARRDPSRRETSRRLLPCNRAGGGNHGVRTLQSALTRRSERHP
jgi:hypothetical protein